MCAGGIGTASFQQAPEHFRDLFAGLKRSSFIMLQKPIRACSVLPEQNHTLKLKDHEP
jgi:hypothetical protein